MTLEQLRIFVAVAEREHVTRAAAALNLTQSATSAAIQALERSYGARLFDRVGRGILLTEAGRVFLEEARAVLARAAAAERALADLGDLRRGSLAVQASLTIASYWLPRHLARFRANWPDVRLNLTIANTAQVARAVAEGSAELGFVEGTVEDPSLTSLRVASDRLIVVVGPAHDWAAHPPQQAKELVSSAWVMRESGSRTRGEFEVALAGLGVDPRLLSVTLELPSNEAVRSAAEAGVGATVLSELVVADALRAGTLIKVGPDLPERAFHVLRHKERYQGRAATALLEIITAAGGS